MVRRFDHARVLIGRSIVCDLVVDDEAISRKHAEIVREPSGWTIADLHTRSGTAVNGQTITKRSLADGDRILLAPGSTSPTQLVFSLCREMTSASSVILSDESVPMSVMASIDLHDFSKTLSAHSFDISPLKQTAPTALPGARAAMRSRSQLPALGLFKSAAEALLVGDTLDVMLQKVIDLIIRHLPGRRGVICMVDETTDDAELGNITPRYYGAAHDTSPASAAPFLVSRSILQEAIRVRRAMLVTSALDDPRFDHAESVHQLGIRAAMCVPLYHEGRVQGIIYVDSLNVDSQHGGSLHSGSSSDFADLETLAVLALMVAGGIRQLSLRADLLRERTFRTRLERYNSPQVVEQILRQDRRFEEEMLVEEVDVSVLFADLCGFTMLADNWSAAEVVHVLNEIFEQFTAIVFAHDGTLDKYIGDAVMAVFGAPLRQADHAARAVRAAIDLQRQLQAFNMQHADRPPLAMRIGINSGRVIAGDIGSPVHKAYTVIGDVVNVASRLERSIAQAGEIIVGPATYEQSASQFAWEPLPAAQLRGKRDLIVPYRLLV